MDFISHLIICCFSVIKVLFHYKFCFSSHLKSSNEIDTSRTDSELDWMKSVRRQRAFFCTDCESVTKDTAVDRGGFENIALGIAPPPPLRTMQTVLNGGNTATKGEKLALGQNPNLLDSLMGYEPPLDCCAQIDTWCEPSSLASLCNRQLYLWGCFLGGMHYFGGFVTR